MIKNVHGFDNKIFMNKNQRMICFMKLNAMGVLSIIGKRDDQT